MNEKSIAETLLIKKLIISDNSLIKLLLEDIYYSVATSVIPLGSDVETLSK